MKNFKLFLAVLSIASLAALCPAPIEHFKNRQVSAADAASSNQMLQQDQSKQSVIGNVGTVNNNPANNVNPAEFRSNTQMADQALSVAAKQEQEKQDAKNRGIIGGSVKVVTDNAGIISEGSILVLLGIASVFGLKRWADKNLPEAPSGYNKKQTW